LVKLEVGQELKSKVVGIDSKNDRIFIEGLTQNTADGKEEAVPIRPSNIIVTKLYEGDPLRIKRITERSSIRRFSRMSSSHIKRLMMPRSWPLPRKTKFGYKNQILAAIV
jgi:ribosomal protein L24